MKATHCLALVASVTGVILRGPSVTSDTYIRNLWPTWNLNTQTRAWWDGPLVINPATQIISAINTDTSAILIKFDLRSFVGASLVPNKRAWLNYYVNDAGDNSSLRELVVPWNDVRAHADHEDARTPLTHNRVRHPGRDPFPLTRPSLCPSLLSTVHSHVEQPPFRKFFVEKHQR